jgi:hypothetical protein
LAVAEELASEGRQAAAIVLRETYPGYLMPLGVWNVRESIRMLMKETPTRHDTFAAALKEGLSQMRISANKWKETSVLISRELTQTKITRFS